MSGGRDQYDEDRFAIAARADASRHVPDFSGRLHEQIMQAVRATDRRPVINRPPAAAQWIFAAAALLLIAVTVAPTYLRWRAGRIAGAPGVVSRVGTRDLALSPAPLGATLVSLGKHESAMEADLGPANWAGLDHDARLAARYVLDPISLPTHSRAERGR